MKLSLKLAAAYVLGACVVLGAFGVSRVRREVALFERDTRRDHQAVGRTLAGALARRWQERGRADALALIPRLDQNSPGLEVRWVDVRPGGSKRHLPWIGIQSMGPVAIGEPLTMVERDRGGAAPAVLSYFPVKVSGKTLGAVELHEVMLQEQRYILRTIQRSIGTGALVVLLCGGLATVLGFWIVGRPVQRLRRHLKAVAAGDLSGRLELNRSDELGLLSREIDAMTSSLAESRGRLEQETAAREEATAQLRHADRLLVVGKLAAGIAHELGTPLNVVTARAELLAAGALAGDEAASSAQIIIRQAGRMAQIIQKLLDFARKRPPDRTPNDLRVVARRSVELMASLARERGVGLELEVDGEAVAASVDEAQLQQVLSNLIINGVQATPRGEAVTVAVRLRQLRRPGEVDGQEQPTACVEVKDRGFGVAPQLQERIFEPFFTTRDVGQGAGLGLAVSHGIVAEHDGWIAVESAQGQGACFSVCLPTA